MERPSKSGATAAQVLAPVLRRDVAELRAAEAEIRLGHAPAVHDFRIAARRLRSLLDSAPALFESTRELTSSLRAAGRTASGSRDSEVLLLGVTRLVADEPGDVGSRLRGRLDRALEDKRQQHWLDLVDYFDSPDFDAMARRLDGFADLTPWSGLAREPAKEVLKPLLDLERRRFDARLERVSGLPPQANLDEALHDLRKRAKTLRYFSDALVPVLGDRAKKVRKPMRRLQTVLGDLNDSLVLVAFLELVAATEALDADERGVLRRVIERARSRSAQLRSEFLDLHRNPHRSTSVS